MRRIIHLTAIAVFVVAPLLSVLGWGLLWFALAALATIGIIEARKEKLFQQFVRIYQTETWVLTMRATDLASKAGAL